MYVRQWYTNVFPNLSNIIQLYFEWNNYFNKEIIHNFDQFFSVFTKISLQCKFKEYVMNLNLMPRKNKISISFNNKLHKIITDYLNKETTIVIFFKYHIKNLQNSFILFVIFFFLFYIKNVVLYLCAIIIIQINYILIYFGQYIFLNY